jgi:hypothetical protein
MRTPETRLKEAETMMAIGVDAHKRTHTLVAIDDVGKKLAERTLAATSEGHLGRPRLGGAAVGDRRLPASHPPAGVRPARGG